MKRRFFSSALKLSCSKESIQHKHLSEMCGTFIKETVLWLKQLSHWSLLRHAMPYKGRSSLRKQSFIDAGDSGYWDAEMILKITAMMYFQ